MFSGYQKKSFQTDNLTQELKDRGLKSTDGIDRLFNVEGALGGPIKKDKVWFFGSLRIFHLDTLPADVLRSLADIWVCASAAQWGQPYETWWLDLDDPDVAALYRDHDTAACDAESEQTPEPWDPEDGPEPC